jgi:hypothetical protein
MLQSFGESEPLSRSTASESGCCGSLRLGLQPQLKSQHASDSESEAVSDLTPSRKPRPNSDLPVDSEFASTSSEHNLTLNLQVTGIGNLKFQVDP